MTTHSVSRRSILKSLTMGAVAGSVMRRNSTGSRGAAHHMIQAEKGKRRHVHAEVLRCGSYKTLQTLCETILPADADSGGAIEGGCSGVY